MSVRKRGPVWQYIVELGRDASGRRRQLRRSGFKTKREAEAAELAERMERGNGLAPGAERLTVEAYLWRWLEGKKLNPRTRAGYETKIRLHVVPRVGAIRLQKLRPLDVQALYQSIASENVRVAVHTTIMAPALEQAVKWELLGRNPARQVDVPKREKRQREDFPTVEEIRAILAAGDGTEFGDVLRFAVLTGLRRGELLGLRWHDIDGAAIRVRQQVVKTVGVGYGFDAPKSKSSERTVTVGPAALALLAAVRRRQAEEKMRERLDYADHGLVFADALGEVIGFHRLWHAWLRVTAVAGVPGMRFHQLRHAYATLALKGGVPMKVVSENLGHASITITMDLYSHVLPDMKADAAARVEGMLR